jgi:outer membrane protein OmpA-like peptidoglycan-associated protein
VLLALAAVNLSGQTQLPSDAPERTNYLTFAQGAIPLRVSGAASKLGASFEEAIRATDGDPLPFGLTLKPGAPDMDTEFLYQLPALTTFDRFAVPNVWETPGPRQTFTKQVEVQGSASGPDSGFVVLGSGTLTTHKGRGQVTELTVQATTPVRWVKLRLSGGIVIDGVTSFFEFSEIIGNGTQEAAELVTHFTGVWQGRGVLIGLRQQGAVVSGCYDSSGDLKGTVTGNILRATGVDRGAKVVSLFVLSVADDGTMRGLRSSNKGPFQMYTGAAAPAGAAVKCREIPPPTLGCGSIVHGIRFGFDSADITSDSGSVLTHLFQGLRGEPSASIVIEGHTSSEGTEQYNQSLSERRAQAVVADLVRRGLESKRISAAGLGESRPIASNTDEIGRSLNRRVEVRCT